jgi:hypothetical protein
VRYLSFLVVAWVVAQSSSVLAAQLAFQHQVRGDVHRYTYRFETPHNGPVDISFTLANSTVSRSLNAFGRFDPRDLRRRWAVESRRLLRVEVQKLSGRFPAAKIELRGGGRIHYALPMGDANSEIRALENTGMTGALADLRSRYPHVRIQFDKPTKRISINGFRSESERRRVSKSVKRAMRQIRVHTTQLGKKLKRRAALDLKMITRDLDKAVAGVHERLSAFEASYFHERYYRKGRGGILIPDYPRIAIESVSEIAPITAAWRQRVRAAPRRDDIDALLGFFQSIPYDTLQSRGTSNGAGFATPPALIARNRGDCDTKSVALAALLHSLAPKLPIVMVLLRDHALLGIGIAPDKGDATLTHAGNRYVLIEPVGPGLRATGKVDRLSRKRVKQVLRLF